MELRTKDKFELLELLNPEQAEELKQKQKSAMWSMISSRFKCGAIGQSELTSFIETIPESILPHLSEQDIQEEYFHHYGKP